MASRTQIRLGQLTGSLGTTAGKIRPDDPAGELSSKVFSDLSGSLSAMLSGISRIHGRDGNNALNNAAGTFYTNILPSSDAINIGADNAEFGSIFIGDEKGLKIGAGQEHTIADGNTGLLIDSSEAIEINSSAAGISIGNDAVAQPINVGTGAAARTITVGNDASTKVDVNALAIELDSAGSIVLDSVTTTDIDSTGALSLNSSAAAINIGNDAVAQAINVGTGAAARTITVGNDASTEVEVNALVVDVNAIGTAANALTIDSAGGIDVTAAAEHIDITANAAGKFININAAGSGATQLVLTSAGTSAQAVNINATGTGGGVDIDANSAIGINSAAGVVTLSGSNGATSVTVESPATFSDNVIVTGDLTVNGTTTTVNSTTVTIDDPVFTLGGDSAPGSDDNKDRGIEFRYHDGSDPKLGFFGFDDSTGRFVALGAATNSSEVFSGTKLTLEGGGIIDDSLTATHVVYAGSSKELKGENTFTYTEGSNLLRVDHIQIDSDSDDLISIENSNLTLASATATKIDAATKIVLDTDSGIVEFFDNTADFGRVELSSDLGLTLSSSAGNDVALASQSGFVSFLSKNLSSAANAAVYSGTANEIFFGNWNPQGADVAAQKAVPGNLLLKKTAVSVLSASSGLQIDAGAANAELQLLGTDGPSAKLKALSSGLGLEFKNAADEQVEMRFFSGSNYVSLKAPPAFDSGNFTLTLPQSDGDADQVLTTDGSGNLTFASPGAATKKCVRIITDAAGLSAGSGLATDTANPGDQIDDLTSVEKTPALLDVYVNGQLLLTGSVEDVGNGNRDYRVASDTAITFGFDLEKDDIVQVIKR